MQNTSGLIRIKRKTFLYVVFTILILGIATPVLAAYLGPNRTVTETTGACKVVLYECQYVPAKDDYRYKRVEDWACSNESKPWKDYDSSGPACEAWSNGRTYWENEESQQETTTTYPPATISGSIQNCTLQNGWCTTVPQLSLSGSEPVSGYSIIALEGSLNGQNFACANSNCSVPLNEGNNNLTFWALSSWGDSSTMGTLNTKVDTQQPTISGAFSGTTGSNGWYLSPATFTGAASDATSGLASFTCALDGAALGSCNSITVNGEGTHTLTLTARDTAGNTRTVTQNTSLDTQNPILNASLSGTMGSNNWYTNVILNGSASDPSPGSGLSTFEHNLDNTGWVSFPGSGALALPEGKHSVDLLARDMAGRTVSSSKSFWLDSVPPNVEINPTGTLGANDWYTTNLNLVASTNDMTSGVDVFEYILDSGTWTTYATPLTISDGSHNISFWSQDVAGLVTQVDRTYKVDTQVPKIAGSLSGVPGTNAWYISTVTLSASASDPAPGSGMDAFTYILNNGPETSYMDALVFSDGEHTIQFNAQDKAGLTYSLEQKLKVDTIHPSLNVQTTLPNWVRDTITLQGTSSDGGSGLSKVEISTNGGQSWQPVIGTASWNYSWKTTENLNGIYEVRVRTTDNAGLSTERNFNAGVDNHGPKISVPDSWFQWDTVTLDVWDNHSGLSEVRVEISDPEGRWPTRKINLDPERFPLDFKWDRRFADGTVAPLGTYGLKVIAFDKLGNLTRTNASINILLGILPAGPAATPQPYVRTEETQVPATIATPVTSSIVTQAPVMSEFGSTPEPNTQPISIPETAPTPRATPAQTDVIDWLQSIFVPDVNGDAVGETVTEIGLGEDAGSIPQAATSGSNVLWGATAAAMIGAVTAYALEERRKQQEEAARQAMLEAQKEERHEKMQARKMEKLEAKWAQERAWEEAREEARLEAEGRAQYQASERSWSLPYTPPKVSILETEEEAWLEKKTQADKQPKPKDDLQAGLAAYYAAMRQGEEEAKTNWWENTKSFVSEKIVEPYIKPAMERTEQFVSSETAWIKENLYQPHIKPAVENAKQFIINESAWINEHIYQPYVKPVVERTKEFVHSEATWINENLYQPYIRPVVEKTKPFVKSEIAWINEKIYQPAANAIKENPYVQAAASLVNEKIYEPFFKPVVDDVSTWTENTWDKYGEWVHGALDTAGFIPGLGEIADGINGLIYLGEGRYVEASVSLIAMIPVIGDLGKVSKLTVKIGQEVLEEAAEKVVKETAEALMEKTVKESLDDVVEISFKETSEELVEKTLKETAEDLVEEVSQTVTAKATKEIADGVPANVANATTVMPSNAQEVVEENTQQFINSLTEKFGEATLHVIQTYGDDGVALFQQYGEDVVDFVKWAEKLGVNPIDVLDNPPLPGQTLEGWLLKIDDLNSPVNIRGNLKLSSSRIDHLLRQSLHRFESNEFALGFFDPNEVDGYLELAEKRQIAFLAMKESLYNEVGFKDGDFWQINRAAIQFGMDQRKTFVLSTPMKTILENPGKYTYAEIQMILHPGNNYIHVYKDGYDMLIPAESLMP